jgi:formate dehydrogenase subunit gamma
VREGDAGYTAVPGAETGVLIQNGENWRQLRNRVIANYGGWFLLGVLVAIALFFALRGTVKIDGGRSGVRIKRWNAFERTIHWSTATLFFILTVTGLSMLFGRAVLIPVLGPKGFAAWADLAMAMHNYLGPWFGGLVVVMMLMWIRHNIPDASDFKWFAKGGGMVGKAHPDAGMTNGGEKLWFWFICTVGMVVIAAGLVLNFPNWGFTRSEMQLANMVHSIGAMAWVALWFGHAYIGTVGSEGSLEAMTTGYVDENWARQHHNLWLDDVKSGGAASARHAGSDEDTIVKGSPA